MPLSQWSQRIQTRQTSRWLWLLRSTHIPINCPKVSITPPLYHTYALIANISIRSHSYTLRSFCRIIIIHNGFICSCRVNFSSDQWQTVHQFHGRHQTFCVTAHHHNHHHRHRHHHLLGPAAELRCRPFQQRRKPAGDSHAASGDRLVPSRWDPACKHINT